MLQLGTIFYVTVNSILHQKVVLLPFVAPIHFLTGPKSASPWPLFGKVKGEEEEVVRTQVSPGVGSQIHDISRILHTVYKE